MLWPNGQKNECDEVMIYLETKESIHDGASVQWKIQILNDRGVPHGPHRFIYASKNMIKANHFSSFLLKHSLFFHKKTGEPILPNDTLNIKIEVRF